MGRVMRLKLRDIALSVVDFGGESLPLLLLHGLAGSALEWHAVAQRLKRSHRVFALDQRGHGRSDKPKAQYARGYYVGDVIGVIEGLRLAPVALVGQSMGGLNAFLAAAARPDLISKLVLIEASPARNPNALRDVNAWLSKWPVRFATRESAIEFFGGDNALGRGWVRTLERDGRGLRARFRKDAIGASMADIAARDYWAEWSRVRCPTLVLAGECGQLAAVILREMQRRSKRVRIERLPGIGHDAHLEGPAVVADRINAFLRA